MLSWATSQASPRRYRPSTVRSARAKSSLRHRIPLVTGRLVRRLAFEGGFRKSWYDNGTSQFSTDAYKLALDLTVVLGLRLRASQQRANRVPNVQELFAPAQPSSLDRDPCAGATPDASEAQCALAGVMPGQYGHVLTVHRLALRLQFDHRRQRRPATGNRDHSHCWHCASSQVLRGFNATVDWWDIRLDGAIAQIGAQTIIDDLRCDGRSLIFCSRIHRDPNGSLWLGNGHIDDRQANIGAPAGARYRHRRGLFSAAGPFGSANFEFRGSYVLNWIIDKGGLSTPYDCAGLFGDPCGIQPRWKHAARATWNTRLGFLCRFAGGTSAA